jgi:hypothetical protein
MTGTLDSATDPVRRYYDKSAARYNRQIAFFERVLFGDGRRWVCSQAEGDTLEVALGTGRNLRFYPPAVRLIYAVRVQAAPEGLGASG